MLYSLIHPFIYSFLFTFSLSRRAVFLLYTDAQVHLLPGYPKQNGDDLLFAFYVQKPTDVDSDTKVVPALILVKILKENKTEIQALFDGKEVTDLKPFKEEEPTGGPKGGLGIGAWIGIGIACLLLAIVLVLLVYLAWYVYVSVQNVMNNY